MSARIVTKKLVTEDNRNTKCALKLLGLDLGMLKEEEILEFTANYIKPSALKALFYDSINSFYVLHLSDIKSTCLLVGKNLQMACYRVNFLPLFDSFVIGNVYMNITDSDLRNIFSVFGNVFEVANHHLLPNSSKFFHVLSGTREITFLLPGDDTEVKIPQTVAHPPFTFHVNKFCLGCLTQGHSILNCTYKADKIVENTFLTTIDSCTSNHKDSLNENSLIIKQEFLLTVSDDDTLKEKSSEVNEGKATATRDAKESEAIWQPAIDIVPGSVMTIPDEGEEGCLAGLTFIVTGVLESLERDKAKALIEKYGGKVMPTVSKNTKYMVVGRDAGSSKLDKAEKLGVAQLDEDGLLNLLRNMPGKKGAVTPEQLKKNKKSEETSPSTSKNSPKDTNSEKKKILDLEEEFEMNFDDSIVLDSELSEADGKGRTLELEEKEGDIKTVSDKVAATMVLQEDQEEDIDPKDLSLLCGTNVKLPFVKKKLTGSVFTCITCSAVYPTKFLVLNHLADLGHNTFTIMAATEVKSNIFCKCLICNYISIKSKIMMHLHSSHLNRQLCGFCENWFDDLHDFSLHLTSVHNLSEAELPAKSPIIKEEPESK